MTAPFIIYALPRSGTTWAAALLSCHGWTCHHSAATTLRQMADIRAFFARPRTGTAETSAALGWRIVSALVPGIRMAVIRRPVEDSVRAMLRVDLRGAAVYDERVVHAGLEREARAIDELAMQPGVLAIDFADLFGESASAALFEHCLQMPFDRHRWLQLREWKIVPDVPALLRYYQANRAAVDQFKAACKREMFRLARAGLISRTVEG
jgi:hypothetical protein